MMVVGDLELGNDIIYYNNFGETQIVFSSRISILEHSDSIYLVSLPLYIHQIP